PPVVRDDDIVGGVELFAVEAVHQNGPGAVVFAAAHPAGVVLAGDQPALAVTRVTVGVSGLGLEHAYVTVILDPAQHAVIRDIAPKKAAPIPHPTWTFVPQRGF